MAASFEINGHTVHKLQEGEIRASEVVSIVKETDAHLFVWTQTYGLAVTGGTLEERSQMVKDLRSLGIPSVGYHLDKWWGLAREDQIYTEPFFKLDYLFTPDGANQKKFEELGINHHWLPPAVYEKECIKGIPRKSFISELAFVGNWAGGYHPESNHRHELIKFLQREYEDKIKFWPERGRPAVRGLLLNDLYASVKVVVGDSCRVGNIQRLYHSDRIPETLGRGGFLLHPRIDGVTDDLYLEDKHLGCWEAWDWKELREKIDYFLGSDDRREEIRETGHLHVKNNHTYTHRVKQVLAVLAKDGVIPHTLV